MAKARTGLHLPGFKVGVSRKTKLVIWLGVAALLWWIIGDPTGAAHKFTAVFQALKTFFASLRG
jgi:hypothetical protein